jgi:hypothetical protein
MVVLWRGLNAATLGAGRAQGTAANGARRRPTTWFRAVHDSEVEGLTGGVTTRGPICGQLQAVLGRLLWGLTR